MTRPFPTAIFALAFCMIVSHGLAQEPKPDARFLKWDKNNDSKLSPDELPPFFQGNFDRVDTNSDGSISIKEHIAFTTRQKSNSARTKFQIPEGTKILRDVEYVDQGHERHKLDIYLPHDAKPDDQRPLVIWIHGGGWRKGSKQDFKAMVPLLNKGFAVSSINYRLSDQAIFPAQIHDCKAAVRFLRSNTSKYGLDPERFGVWGSSAGGHLVALTGTSGDVQELEGKLGVTDVSSRVQAVCDWFGPTDFIKMNEQAGAKSRIDHDAPDSPESKLLGGPLQQSKEKAKQANPMTYVSKDDPPFLIMHGDQDGLVPLQQSQALDKSLDEASVESELVVVEGAGHGFWEQEHIERVVQFFLDELGDSAKDNGD